MDIGKLLWRKIVDGILTIKWKGQDIGEKRSGRIVWHKIWFVQFCHMADGMAKTVAEKAPFGNDLTNLRKLTIVINNCKWP